MERILTTPRHNWQTQVEALGCSYYMTGDKVYWNESAYYYFTAQEISLIQNATLEIEMMCMELIEDIVKECRYNELDIPEYAWAFIESSWRKSEPQLCGRLDFSFDGIHPPKLLEYNADTATSLLEASLLQKQWLEQTRPNHQQFNHLHERLVATWPQFNTRLIHLTCVNEEEDDDDDMIEHIAYLGKTIYEAGLRANLLTIEKIGWNGDTLLDENDLPITTLLKAYSWEWFSEAEFKRIVQSHIQLIEPAWKMLLSNKGLMVLLWKMFPHHPNLLPSFFEQKHLSGDYVKKPLQGQCGENVSIHSDRGVIVSPIRDNKSKFIYQQAHLLPNFAGNYPVIGSWLIAGEAAGIGLREDDTPITLNECRFVPHCFD